MAMLPDTVMPPYTDASAKLRVIVGADTAAPLQAGF